MNPFHPEKATISAWNTNIDACNGLADQIRSVHGWYYDTLDPTYEEAYIQLLKTYARKASIVLAAARPWYISHLKRTLNSEIESLEVRASALAEVQAQGESEQVRRNALSETCERYIMLQDQRATLFGDDIVPGDEPVPTETLPKETHEAYQSPMFQEV